MNLSRILKVSGLLAVLGGALYVYPPARLAVLVLARRSPDCPYPQAVRAAEELRRQIQLKDEILKASREVEKDPAGYHLWETPRGRFWMPAGSDYVLPWNLAEQARKIYGTRETAARSGDIVLDCGANVGVYTRDALEAGAKVVVAIEPAPENIECLRRNFAPEIAAGRVIVYPKGVWDRDDFLTLNVDPGNSAADSFLIQPKGSQGLQQVPLTTIDKLVVELKLDRIDLIKMDIEGAEPKALEGGRQTLVRFKPRLTISAYHMPDHPRLIPATIRAARADYRMECGPCSEVLLGVRPDILYFY